MTHKLKLRLHGTIKKAYQTYYKIYSYATGELKADKLSGRDPKNMRYGHNYFSFVKEDLFLLVETYFSGEQTRYAYEMYYTDAILCSTNKRKVQKIKRDLVSRIKNLTEVENVI